MANQILAALPQKVKRIGFLAPTGRQTPVSEVLEGLMARPALTHIDLLRWQTDDSLQERMEGMAQRLKAFGKTVTLLEAVR